MCVCGVYVCVCVCVRERESECVKKKSPESLHKGIFVATVCEPSREALKPEVLFHLLHFSWQPRQARRNYIFYNTPTLPLFFLSASFTPSPSPLFTTHQLSFPFHLLSRSVSSLPLLLLLFVLHWRVLSLVIRSILQGRRFFEGFFVRRVHACVLLQRSPSSTPPR